MSSTTRLMKDSGVAWLGQIPSNWQLVKAKSLFRQRNEKGNPSGELLAATQANGMFPQRLLEGVVRVKEDSDLQSFKTVRCGDFVISLRSFQGGFEISEYEGVCSPAYQVFFPLVDVFRGYFKYLFKSSSFIAAMDALTVGIREGKSIRYSDFANSEIPVPPLEEQRRIADFLDEQCGRIDEVRQTLADEIDALKRLRKATIHQAVTKGLDPSAPLKPSEIPWINEVPASWGVVPMKVVCSFGKGIQYNKADLCDEGFRVISYGQIHSKQNNGVSLSGVPVRFASLAVADANRQAVVKQGNLMFAATSEDAESLGNAVLIDGTSEVLAGTDTIIARISEECFPKYLAYLFKTDCWRDQFRRDAIEVKVYHLSATKLRRTTILKPPLEEQQRIADFLDERCAAIDSIIDTRTKQLERLEDYRKALIFAYVTGKKEVA